MSAYLRSPRLCATSSVNAGLGLGLFGVLSIIRLRSEELAQHEIAYYFAALALGLIGGLSITPTALHLALMALIVVALWIGDHALVARPTSRQEVLLDRAFTDGPELRAHLHFRPVVDSIRVYAQLLAFSASSLLGFLTDTVVLLGLMSLTGSLVVAAVVAPGQCESELRGQPTLGLRQRGSSLGRVARGGAVCRTGVGHPRRQRPAAGRPRCGGRKRSGRQGGHRGGPVRRQLRHPAARGLRAPASAIDAGADGGADAGAAAGWPARSGLRAALDVALGRTDALGSPRRGPTAHRSTRSMSRSAGSARKGASRAAYSMNILASRCESPRTESPVPTLETGNQEAVTSCAPVRDAAGWDDRDHSGVEVPSDRLARNAAAESRATTRKTMTTLHPEPVPSDTTRLQPDGSVFPPVTPDPPPPPGYRSPIGNLAELEAPTEDEPPDEHSDAPPDEPPA